MQSSPYTFYTTDHLGSVRVVANSTGNVLETNDYYPYGMLMDDGAKEVQPYKYSGKELDRMHGLNMYDHGARMSDPAIGRWHVVDPLCEKYYDVSPYVMCADNPVNYVDRDGKKPTKEEAARMAAHVYGDKSDDILMNGWHPSNLHTSVEYNTKNGLNSRLYERVVNGKVTEYVYATAGTIGGLLGEDAKQDLKQLNGKSEQYADSKANAEKISAKVGKMELTFVGHSLGGGEAAVNLLATANENNKDLRHAITFNAAGVSAKTLNNLNLNRKYERNITSYENGADVLSWLQRSSSLPSALGRRVTIPQPLSFPSFGNHSIDSF